MPTFEVLIDPIKLAPDKYLSHYRKSNWSELSFSTFRCNQLLLEDHENNFSKSSLLCVFAPIYQKYVTVMIVEFTFNWLSVENR